jgi:hypothetical protein
LGIIGGSRFVCGFRIRNLIFSLRNGIGKPGSALDALGKLLNLAIALSSPSTLEHPLAGGCIETGNDRGGRIWRCGGSYLGRRSIHQCDRICIGTGGCRFALRKRALLQCCRSFRHHRLLGRYGSPLN